MSRSLRVRGNAARAILVAVLQESRETEVQFLAAAVAFYGFVSVIPLFLLGLAAGRFLDSRLLETALTSTEVILTPASIEAIRQSATGGAGGAGITIVGVLFLSWSAIKVFRGLDIAFSRVYGVGKPESLGGQVIDALIVLVGIPVAVAAGALLGVILPLFDWFPFIDVVSRIALLPVLGLFFFPMYLRFPDVPVSPRDALPGTLVATVGWTALAAGFGAYAASIGRFHLYGVLGAGLLLVTWLYLGGIIIMVGAVLNAVLAGGPADGRPSTDRSDSDRTEAAPDLADLEDEVAALREDLDAKTVSRSELEADLRGYVRKRMRRGKARGWGPYLVLLYGTVMTLGAFYWLSGGWAILAMIVVWLSTLGLYVLFVLFGAGIQAAGVPGRVLEAVRDFRS